MNLEIIYIIRPFEIREIIKFIAERLETELKEARRQETRREPVTPEVAVQRVVNGLPPVGTPGRISNPHNSNITPR